MGSGEDLDGLPACETGETTVEPATKPEVVEPFDLPPRFEVGRVLGRGGMGVVVAAYDRSLERDVAIKMIRLDRQDPRVRERFLREARAAAPLRDRGIVQVHDIDPDGKYIVMELVRGESLAARLARVGTLSTAEVVRIGRALADALAVAHEAGVVHRDVKPGNVLLDDTGGVKLADFGVARVTDSELTADGAQVGTPAYMAPEQLRGTATDARADVYAAGATLFRAATGHGLHDKRVRDVAAAIVEATGDRVLAGAIARAVRDDPAERFFDGRALAVALTASTGPALRRIMLALGAAAMVGIVWWLVARDRASTPAPTPASPILVAVEPIHATTFSYAAMPPDATAIGDVLAILLGDIDGIRAAGASEARTLDAGLVVRGTIEQRGTMFVASIELVGGDHTNKIEQSASSIPALLDALADQIAARIDPTRSPHHGPTAQLSRALYARGEPKLARLDFDQARPFLDQAVAADPSYFDAWYALASARSWMMAPERDVEEAIDAAFGKASPGPKKQLLDGASRFMHHDYAGARAALEPLVANNPLDKVGRRDALYYLGEANWHDGRHAAAAELFKRALELDGRFKPSALHLGEYALARRDHAMAVYVGGLLEQPNQDPYEFMEGHYEALLHGSSRFRLYARLALGQRPEPADEALADNDRIYRVARALGDGDAAAARTAIDAVWAPILAHAGKGPIADATYLELKTLADVLLCAGETEQLRRITAFMTERSTPHPVYGLQRIKILAAPLTGDQTIARDGLTERELALADAIAAELSGDRARAVAILGRLVADPSSSWDYPERVALLRNLRALGRTKEARAVCDDTLRPAVFAWAYLPVRRLCLTGAR